MLRRRRASVYLAVAMSAALGLLAPMAAEPAVVFAATIDDPLPAVSDAVPDPAGDPAPDSAPVEETPDAADAASLFGAPDVMPLVAIPDDSGVSIGTGPKPLVTSAMSPTGTIASGTARTFTVGYENTQSTSITNARLWHQLMVGAGHTTTFGVTCASTISGNPGGACPGWVPSGTETIAGGVGGAYFPSFAGVFTFQPFQKLTFTVAVTSTFSAGVCTENGSATAGGWARYSTTGFADADIDADASSVGALSGASVCTPGDITMTNTVTSPYDASIPAAQGQARVLSGDARTFTVTWRNASTTTAYSGVDLRYVYSVPYTGHVTQASWSCTATGGGQPCPAGLTGSASIVHSNPGEPSEVVFSVPGVGFPVGQQYTVVVTLTTTLNACSESGEVGARTYAFRSAIGSETTERRTSSLAPLPIGCTTWMLNETFTGAGLTDLGWKGLGNACLTAAPSGSTPTNGLGYCTERTNSPTTTFQMPTGTPKGFLQLTDDRGDRVGAVLYNRALPSEDGLVVEFTTYQYGNDAAGADGIGFFLTDGAYELTATGGMGGALGYAYRTSTSWPTEQGAAHGYLGVGLDVYGNFVNPSHTAPGCGGSGTAAITQSVALRGSGNGRTGYCLVAQNRVSSAINKTLDKPSAAISGTGATYDTAVRTALDAAKRKVRVTVWPLEGGATNPRVTVEIQFPGENYYRTVIDARTDSPAPSLIKFGFMAATGGSKQAHLLDAVRVGTVLQMKELNLTKVVDYAANADPTKTLFDVGDVVNYKFVVHNATQAASGISTIYNILVTDPLISSISCPATQLARLTSMTCTGSLTVTAASRDAGRLRNTASVAGSISSDPAAPRNLTDRDSVEVPVNPLAPDDTRVIPPQGTATFQVIKSGATLGIVTPDDPTRLKLEVFDPGTSTWVAAPTTGSTIITATNGTWRVYANNTVTFVHATGSTDYAVTDLHYRVTNAYGGSDDALLKVNISIAPWTVCTPTQERAGDRYWAFGTASRFDFGATGTTLTTSTLPGVTSTHGSFTVTDSTGVLRFVVGSDGVIRTSTGAAMTGSPTASARTGASPITVFPAGQGTGKYFVVMSSATTTGAGQLHYWTVDTTQGDGVVTGGAGSTLGTAVASMAVTSVPNADGTGYWVISPRRGSTAIDAYQFTAAGPTSTTPVSTNIGTAEPVRTTNYEDIRFSADSSRIAALASNNRTSSGVNRVRLMSFNAATGVPTLVDQDTFARTSATHGYSVEFAPNGTYLYASRIGTGTSAGTLYRATVSAGALGTIGSAANAPDSNFGGAVRTGADGRLYWAQSGNANQVRVVTSPNSGSTTSIAQNLAGGASSTYGLSNTLSDCAIPPTDFFVEKYNSNGVRTGGAVFALYPDAGGSAGTTPLDPGIAPTGVAGQYQATGIAPGSYWIRETTTLGGHSLLPQDVLIVVKLGGVIQLDSLPNPQVQLVNNAGVYTIKITNDATLTLPLVGGTGTAWLLAGGSVLVLVALLGAWWWRRRRDRLSGP